MRIKALIAILALTLCAPAHAQLSKASMLATIAGCFPTQLTGAITPASVVTCLSTLINSYQQYAGVNAQVGTTYTIAASDYGQLVTLTNSGAVAVSIPSASTTGFTTFNTYLSDLGTGTVTITPAAGTINGAGTLVLVTGQGAHLISDGSNWQVLYEDLDRLPGGSSTDVQFNNSSAFGGDSGFTYAGSGGAVTASGVLRTSSAGSAAAPSLSVGNLTTGLYSVSTTGFGISVNGTDELDYGVSHSGNWSIPSTAFLEFTKATNVGVALGLSAHCQCFTFFNEAIGGYVPSYQYSSYIDYQGVIAFSTTAETPGTNDTGISRASAGVLDFGNGTAADVSGTIVAAHATLNALANSATTSAVCYNTGTGVLTYDSTIGTCTTSDERLKTFDRPLTDSLGKLVALSESSHFGYFRAKGELGMQQFGPGEHIGMGAQTVAEMFPSLTATGTDGYMSLDYAKMTVPIIESLREIVDSCREAANDNFCQQLLRKVNQR